MIFSSLLQLVLHLVLSGYDWFPSDLQETRNPAYPWNTSRITENCYSMMLAYW